jgi:hypothetical protein
MSRKNSYRNEQRSTNNGKKRKRKNALIHGLYSSDVVMPWESRADF